jgi:hypothetical protein
MITWAGLDANVVNLRRLIDVRIVPESFEENLTFRLKNLPKRLLLITHWRSDLLGRFVQRLDPSLKWFRYSSEVDEQPRDQVVQPFDRTACGYCRTIKLLIRVQI